MHSIFLTFLSSAILFALGVLAQNNCQLPIPEIKLRDAVDIRLPPEGGPFIVQIDSTSYNCLTHAQNPTFYLSAGVSIEYSYPGGQPAYIRAEYACSGSTWGYNDVSSSVTTVGSELFLSSAYLRENCSSCSLTAPDEYLCVPCDGSCLDSSNSLEYCYGPDSTECCNFILNATCTIECPVNFEANASGVCVCQNEWVGSLCNVCPIACVNGTPNANCTSCDCIAGFEGNLCDADINECDMSPCANNGTCMNLVNNFTCDCANFWIGRTCDVCSLECGNGTQSSNCTICICDPGYTGESCETDIDECSVTPCANGGSCSDRVNNFTCSCIPFWEGRTCETCSLGCVNGTPSVNCSECLCEAGFSGDLCDVDINECQTKPCMNNGTCQDQINNYTCVCRNEWVGRNCSDCGLTCINGEHSSDCLTCVCDPGYTGDMCGTDINECIPDPCMNNGTCQDQVNNYTCECTNEWSGRNCSECSLTCFNGTQRSVCSSCECTVGFNGSMCEVNIDDCESRPCLNNGTCLDQVNNYTCVCTNEWSGRNCSECLLDCNNGGSSDSCSMCICDSLYTGDSCDVILDPCEPNPCRHEGECVANGTAFECVCLSGYIGEDCGVGVYVCNDSDTCNAGACVEAAVPEEIEGVPPSYCVCPPSYTGEVCDEVISGCVMGACQNGGRCDIGRNELYNLSFTCACRDPFSGPNCQLCPLDGLCQNGIRSADCSRCICRSPYTGTHCSESSCPGGQVIDGNQCKDACSTNNYQPSARNKDICSACGIDNCVQCDKEGGVCTECQVGYMVDKKECVRILLGCGIENCERCYAGICTVCVSNYSLTLDNGCQQIFKNGGRSTNTNNILPIILGSVAGAVLLCIILLGILIGAGLGVVYYKKSKKALQYKETSKKEDEIEFSNPMYLSSDQSKSKEYLFQSL